LLLAAAATAGEPDARPIYKSTLPAVAWIRGQPGATGWLLDRDKKLLVSSSHAVGKEKAVEVFFPEFNKSKLIAERAHYEKNSQPIAGQVIARDAARDLVLIELASVPEGIVALRLAEASAFAGDRLHAVVNTAASQGLWSYSTGLVRQVYRKKEPFRGSVLDARVVVSQLPINAGDSGAPVVNDAGELVAVAVDAVEKTRLVTICTDVTEVLAFTAKFRLADKKKEAGPAVAAKPEKGIAAASAFERALAGIAWVVAPRGGKEVVGTACLVDRPRKLVLTTTAVVGEDETVKVWFPAREDGKLVGQRDHYRKKVEPIQARVKLREGRCGLAVLELPTLPESAVELKLAAQSPAPAEEIHAIGNPIHATGLWVFHTGFVRQVYHRKARLKEGEWDARVMETQSPLNPGDSGGPVVNLQGEIVGIMHSAAASAPFVSYCVSVEEIRGVLKRP
jgi:S1-C subfamily serine protease